MFPLLLSDIFDNIESVSVITWNTISLTDAFAGGLEYEAETIWRSDVYGCVMSVHVYDGVGGVGNLRN